MQMTEFKGDPGDASGQLASQGIIYLLFFVFFMFFTKFFFLVS